MDTSFLKRIYCIMEILILILLYYFSQKPDFADSVEKNLQRDTCCGIKLYPGYNKLSLSDALYTLYTDFGCERITIQSGGELNGLFLREKLFDFVDIVVAPILIGGKNTPTLIDGKSLMSQDELSSLGVLKLESCEVLKYSYLRLRYKVIG